MRLRKLKLKNYRCFGDEVTTVDFNELTVLVGANSTGKTAIMSALAKLFSPDAKERLLERSDFHLPKGRRPQDGPNPTMMIEAVFSFPELQNDADAGTLGRQTVPQVFNQMKVLSDGEMIVRIRLTATWSKGTTPEGEIDSVLEFIVAAEDVEDKEEHRKKLSAQQRSHIQFIYVPAVRDPLSQSKLQAGALLKRLFEVIQWSEALPADVEKQAKAISNLFANEPGFRSIQSLMAEQWKRYQDEDRFREVTVGFTSADLANLLKKVELKFKPTFEEKAYTADQLGDGLRSMFYLSLVSTVLALENRLMTENDLQKAGLKDHRDQLPALTILGVEEPENHLSPQVLGKVVKNLIDTAKQPNADVVMSSHSPAILRRVPPTQVRHLRIDRETESALVRMITLPKDEDEAHKYVKEAVQAYPELYFARFVILGEGDSEEDVLPRVLEAHDCQLDRQELAMVPLGGRHVNHFWRLLRDLGIPFVTLLDFDQERKGGDWGRIKYALEQLLTHGVPDAELLTYTGKDGKQYQKTRKEVAAFPAKRSSTEVRPISFWLQRLRKHDVFFSTPLDLDFMMLAHYFDRYKAIVGKGEGPRIPEKTDPAYAAYMADAKRAVFKENGRDGASLAGYGAELIPWYRNLFLGKRGKPVTHRLALEDLPPEELKNNLPEQLKALTERVLERVKGH